MGWSLKADCRFSFNNGKVEISKPIEASVFRTPECGPLVRFRCQLPGSRKRGGWVQAELPFLI